MKPANRKTCCEEAVRIQERLDRRGLSWSDVGDALDVTDQKLYYWRKKGVPKQHLPALARFLGCSIDWLLTGQADTPDAEDDKAFVMELANTEKLAASEWQVLRTMAESLIRRSA
ncbi:MAG: Uncharacterized protein AWU57_279 [Marinobacter sp. T13-3]|mgnify:CR=1 FL=1|nr:MAG: Uncharacterized protein AWU57_279 [Marinobacter sp. T13-3]